MGYRLLAYQKFFKVGVARLCTSSTVSSTVPSSNKYQPASPELAKELETCYARLDLSFTNTQEAFKSKTNTELVRALVILQLCGVNFLVQNNARILSVMRTVLGKTIFTKLLKSTFYGHFVAGENKKEVEPVVARLEKFGVKSILDYSVESDLSSEEAKQKMGPEEADHAVPEALMVTGVDTATIESTIERYTAHEEFADRRSNVVSARSIDGMATAAGGEGFVAIKVTALGRPALLLKLSESIAQAHNFFRALGGDDLQKTRLGEEDFIKKLKDFGVKTDSKSVREWFQMVDFDSDGFMDFDGWNKLLDDNNRLGEIFQVLNIKTGQLEPLITNLSADEEKEFANMVRRTRDVVEHAINRGVRIMIDAEQTYFQPAISRITIEMMRRYNKDRGNVFNTYQTYLKGALQNMECDMQLARRGGWHFGAKLVRGAYMEQERQRALTIGYDDPINPSFEATTEMYERCLSRIADEHARRGKGQVSVMIASHNEETVRFAVNLMKERGIAPSERIMCLAQLYGMCDQVSFSLGQAGYSVYKYLPYGPVEEVLPYLSRRALENGSLLKKSKPEMKLLWTELKRRLSSGQFIYRIPDA